MVIKNKGHVSDEENKKNVSLNFVLNAWILTPGGSLVLVYVIPLEVVGRQYRTLCATVDGWCYGCLILALLAYFVRDWRHLSLVTGLIGLPLALLWL